MDELTIGIQPTSLVMDKYNKMWTITDGGYEGSTILGSRFHDITVMPHIELSVVVVTGYQNIDKRHLTSAVSSVKASDILTPGMTSIDQALEGRIPELVLISNSGEVGATPRIRVRGTSTLLGNREPLWVLDGFIMHDPVNVSNDDLNNPETDGEYGEDV